MIKVYFETTRTGYATMVAIFDDEISYAACLPALEVLAKKEGFDIVTESVDESLELNEVDAILDDRKSNLAEMNATFPAVKYARTCDATGEGMNEGYCFGDGEKYFKYQPDAEAYAKEIGYADLQAAYDDDAYYFTAWEDEGDDA